MKIFDTVSTFAKGVGKKAKGNYDVISINSLISDCEKSKAKLIYEIGEKYYNAYKDNPVDEVADVVENVKQLDEKILNYKNLAEEKKQETDAVKLVSDKAESLNQEDNTSENNTKKNDSNETVKEGCFCTECGARLDVDDVFCCECGHRIVEED